MARPINQSHAIKSSISFFLDREATVIGVWVLYTVVCQIVNIFGVITNIINIVCFVRQGFKDAINVSLLGLSVSDLCSLITMVWTCISFNPSFIAADLPFESLDVAYLVSAMPHFAFTRISSCITAMITLERCISIVAPLKVKHMITPRRAGVIIVSVFITFIFSATPLYVVNRLDRKFSPFKNKTIVGLIFREDKKKVERITFSINNFIIPFCAFVTVAICTVILSSQLRRNTAWRKTTISDGQVDRISNRNLKVAKMVMTISTLFFVCFVPITVIMLAVAFVPDLSLNGKYMNASLVMSGFVYIMESINSSVNIFIYLHMSTKYRDTFRTLFIKGKTI